MVKVQSQAEGGTTEIHADAWDDDSLALSAREQLLRRELNCIASIASKSFFCVGVRPSKLLIDSESESGTQVFSKCGVEITSSEPHKV